MEDTVRRDEIQNRIEAVEAEAATYFAGAHPSLHQVSRPISHAIDDARMFLRLEAQVRDGWLDMAEALALSAEQHLRDVQALINKFGGPQRARAFGGDYGGPLD